jgi:hypothetical protein
VAPRLLNAIDTQWALRRFRRFIASATALLLAVACASQRGVELPVGPTMEERLAGDVVDSQPAHQLALELLAAAQSERSAPEARVAVLESTVVPAVRGAEVGTLPSQTQLRELARSVSVDFAALTFARALGADETSRAVSAVFNRALADDVAVSEAWLHQPDAFAYRVLFAPAWLYRSHPETGADFARQRQLLDRLGIANRLIPTAESGSIEDNAATIAATVCEAAREGQPMILVSTSKAGPEVALALSRLLGPEVLASVAGWVNAGGALNGTPIADRGLRPPLSWIMRPLFWFARWDWEGVRSLATQRSRTRLQGARLPDSIAVINLVAIPMSGTVGERLTRSYRILRREGPNDGIVPLTDTVWPGGANVVALGSDHFLADFQRDDHMLALLQAVDYAVRLRGAESERSLLARNNAGQCQASTGG